ncbi:hypothetical protein AB0903_31155 [Streptomyces sp. NPDC048389]|uniref:hypothetical protein n=1 Tax=Streptomyces sp. NPDC048389 TaxID=3154622 RepID=UPI003455ECBF
MTRDVVLVVLWASAGLTAWGVGLLLVFRILPTLGHATVTAVRTLVRAAPAAALLLVLLGGPDA